MFSREWERDDSSAREQSGGPPCGQIRVLIVGDAGMQFTLWLSFIIIILLFYLQK